MTIFISWIILSRTTKSNTHSSRSSFQPRKYHFSSTKLLLLSSSIISLSNNRYFPSHFRFLFFVAVVIVVLFVVQSSLSWSCCFRICGDCIVIVDTRLFFRFFCMKVGWYSTTRIEHILEIIRFTCMRIDKCVLSNRQAIEEGWSMHSVQVCFCFGWLLLLMMIMMMFWLIVCYCQIQL